MWISRFQTVNYSSFKDSGWIELDPSINVFIGQNNSGKSALLKSLNFPLSNNPHKNSTTFRGTALGQPRVEIDLGITPEEIFRRFSVAGLQANFPVGIGHQAEMDRITKIVSDLDNPIYIELTRYPSQETQPRGGVSIAEFRNNSQQMYASIFLQNGSIQIVGRGMGPDNLARLFSGEKSDSFFYFDAQRLNVGRSGWNSPERLLSNATNLAAVLAQLQGTRRPIFDLIEQHVIDIVGGIDRITVAPRQSEYEILLWPDRSSQFEELAFSLDESGTGVGQLLAIITAMVTTEQSVFLIDEINTFLHPAAVKRLLSLMSSEYIHHQYIISTHSSDVISGSAAERLYLVRRSGFESTVEPISLTDADKTKEVSSALGFSMMDVFGHERIIWVEGPTEEICLPFLARRKGLLNQSGIGFAPVFSTSSFSSGRSASRAATDVYEQAGKQLAPLLKGMAFGLDRERLSDAEVSRLEKSKKKLRFLPRRCLECYLIDPQAIAENLSSLDQFQHTAEAVSDALLAMGGAQKYGAPSQWNGDILHVPWLKRVDAAKLLADVFSSLTDHRVEYRKTRDGISILKHIADREGENANLKELEDFVSRLIEIALRDTRP